MLNRLQNFNIKYLLVILLILVLPIFLLPRNGADEKLENDGSRELTGDDFPAESMVVLEESEQKVEGLPELPQYPNAELIKTRSYTEEGGKGFYIELETGDSIMTVVDWYEKELTDDGWVKVLESNRNQSDPKSFSADYKKPDIQVDLGLLKVREGINKITITHHEGMGEYGPPAKYE